MSAMFGQKYTDRYPDISKDVNYTAVKYSSIANGIKAKVWQPLEGLQFMASRKKIVESIEWALENSESVLLDIIRKAHKEVSRLHKVAKSGFVDALGKVLWSVLNHDLC